MTCLPRGGEGWGVSHAQIPQDPAQAFTLLTNMDHQQGRLEGGSDCQHRQDYVSGPHHPFSIRQP